MDVSLGRFRTRRRAVHAPALGRSWPLAVALAALVVIAGGAIGTTPGRTALVAAAFSLDLAGPSPLQPLDLLTPSPAVDTVYLDSAGRNVEGAVYHPAGGGKHGALILSMGVRAWDLDDPRLVRLASDAARAGVAVMIIDSPELRFDEVRTEEVEDLVQAFQRLQSEPYVDPERVGFFGVSVGGSLALLAAADARISSQVRFVDTLGAYASTESLLEAVTTGAGSAWKASDTAAKVVRKQIIDYATRGDDRVTLLDIFYNGHSEARSKAGSLTRAGRAVLDLLDNTDPSRFPALYAAIDPWARYEMTALSPATVADRLEAPVQVLHSRRDDHVPFSESRALVDSVPGARLEAFEGLDHVDPRQSSLTPGLAADGVRLYAYLYSVIARLR